MIRNRTICLFAEAEKCTCGWGEIQKSKNYGLAHQKVDLKAHTVGSHG